MKLSVVGSIPTGVSATNVLMLQATPPPDPPSEIMTGLYMGRHQEPGTLEGFDVVIGVSKQRPIYPIDHPKATVVFIPLLDDGPPSPEERVLARRAAALVNEHLASGKRVFVSCTMGLNRSGWVVALALRAQGFSGKSAIALLRQRRSLQILTNEFFERDVLRD